MKLPAFDQGWWTRLATALVGGIGCMLLSVATACAQEPVPAAQRRIIIERFEPSGGYLGVRVEDIDEARAKEKKLKEVRGVEVTSVEPESPAEQAGLKKGDVILEFNGYRVDSVAQFTRLVRETPPGRSVEIVVSREGKTEKLTARLGKRPTPSGFRWEREEIVDLPDLHLELPRIVIPDVPRMFTGWRNPRLGIVAEELEGQLAEYFGVERGVLVRSVSPGSPADKAGVKAGDVIVAVNGRRVSSPRELSRELRELDSGRATLKLVRKGKEMEVTVELERAGRQQARRPGIEL